MTLHRWVLGMSLGVVSCTAAPSRSSMILLTSAPSVPDVTSRSGSRASAIAYELLTPKQTGIHQVFDDAHDTYLQFQGAVPAGLLLFDENGQALSYTRMASAVVESGVHSGLLVRTPTSSSYAQAPRASRSIASQAMRAEEGEALPADLASARAQILSAEERLRDVSAELDRMSDDKSAVPLEGLRADLETIQTWINGVNATLVRAHFPVGSSVLALSVDTQRAVLSAAARADEIHVQGGADASGSAAVNSRLAGARAASMRQLLIEGGIEADKVQVIAAQSDYIASNTTSAGRALNRRVDIVFANHTGLPVPLADNH